MKMPRWQSLTRKIFNCETETEALQMLRDAMKSSDLEPYVVLKIYRKFSRFRRQREEANIQNREKDFEKVSL
jgi:hypothetical protein